MTASFVGLAGSMAAVALTVYQGIRYHKWLPKREVAESLEALKLNLADKEEKFETVRESLYKAEESIRRGEELEQWMERTQEDVANLENRKKELDDAEHYLTQILEQVASQEAVLSENRQELAELTSLLEKQRKEILPPEELKRQKEIEANLRAALNEMEGRKAKLTPLLKELTAEVEGLKNAVNELQLQETKFTQEIAGLEVKRDSLQNLIGHLEKVNLQMGGSTKENSQEKSTKLLWEPKLELSEFNAKRSSSEEDALKGAIDHIKASGFIYDDRVVKAFHTSLKCADESPLLVLAGISGTGKSALPMKYAEAMGMHSLVVPVQPGWDSPADLLGFYNHLEGRFRPTDLTRALLQMDYMPRDTRTAKGKALGLWPSSASSRVNLSERMLLVLLDEMNLARVEYYFSEFLSRLELRSGFDPLEDEIKRARAELSFDLGSSGEGQAQALSTFVGRNVLFVGTMNEDESTQTLSDKVIDRSNVMRFGKPNSLELEGVPREAPAPPTRFLSRETWQSWNTKSMSSSHEREVEKWLRILNDHLGRIGRPFAYRVAKGVRAYVCNYPDSSAMGLRDAFADQVELRVLPRLRGLDLHDQGVGNAIDGIHDLVGTQLGDKVLADAIERARKRAGDQLFQWSGVDRLNKLESVGSQA